MIIVCHSLRSRPILVLELFSLVPCLFGTTCCCLSVQAFQLLPSRNIWRRISFIRPLPHRYRHSPWPVDVTELFPRVCCWTLIWLSRHWSRLRRGYWRYRSLNDWLIDWLKWDLFRDGRDNLDFFHSNEGPDAYLRLWCQLVRIFCYLTHEPRIPGLLEGNICFKFQEYGHIHRDCPRWFEPMCWYSNMVVESRTCTGLLEYNSYLKCDHEVSKLGGRDYCQCLQLTGTGLLLGLFRACDQRLLGREEIARQACRRDGT